MSRPGDTASAAYVGTVVHRRLKPRRHAFRYTAYWLLLDLDELPALHRRLRFFSYNARNIFSFRDADHGSGQTAALRAQIDAHLAKAGIDLRGGAVRVLCMPRVLGFVFNPLSVHFCYAADGTLQAILYQVHNTFKERHTYLVGVPTREKAGSAVHQSAPKRFYVSPFLDMALTYRFKVQPPADEVSVVIGADDAAGPTLAAALHGERHELTDALLLRLFFSIPLLTLKVVAAIHWEALRLWLKGISLVPRPMPPRDAVSAIHAEEIAVVE